jgi:hypothetical protein
MSSAGAAMRAAVSISSARAEASRKNGAKSRGPKTPEGKARSSRNALKHGLRAARHLVLPAEDPAAAAQLEAAMFEELAPEGALQSELARQIASAAWRLVRVDRMEAEILTFRDRDERNLGIAATRDANSARLLPTLVRYRAAAHAEFARSLRTLKALQAEAAKTGAAPDAHPARPAAPPPLAHRPRPSEPEPAAGPRPEYALPKPSAPRRTLHEPAARWTPSEPEARRHAAPAPVRPDLTPNEPEPHRSRAPAKTPPPSARPAPAMRATDSQGRMDRPNRCRAHG